jgi:hypothetical protein
MIRILAIELLNRILILVILMIKSLIKKTMVCLDNFGALFSVPELNKVENRCSTISWATRIPLTPSNPTHFNNILLFTSKTSFRLKYALSISPWVAQVPPWRDHWWRQSPPILKTQHIFTRFEVGVAGRTHTVVIWVMTPCSLVDEYPADSLFTPALPW